LLPNRKVITWASWNAETYGGSDPVDRTYTVLFDPTNPTAPQGSIVTQTAHNMFCPGTAMLADGRLLVNGGDDSKSAVTSIYDYRFNTWTRAASMNQERWYNTSVTLPDGDVFTLGGNRTTRLSGTGEIWDGSTDTWKWVPGAVMDPVVSGAISVNRAQEHPRLFVTPSGRLFLPGPTPNMQWYDLGNDGSVTSAGRRGDDEFSQSDVTVPFAPGKLLKAGGNPMYNSGTDKQYWPSSRNSYVIDVSSGSAVVTKIAPMKYPRTFANGVVLPNGQIVVMGGLDNGSGFSVDGAILVPEMFDPATNSWTELAPMAKARPYHSIALLLADGRVLVGGGGLCSYDCPANSPDVQIFSPPYLFNGPRPALRSAPKAVSYGSTFSVTTEGTVTGFSLIRMSSVTHSTNTDQRFLRLDSNGTGATRTVSAPGNRNTAPPGYYLLFALNGDVPSRAAVVQIK
jgi:galactose oxidase